MDHLPGYVFKSAHLQTADEILHAFAIQKALAVQRRLVGNVPHSRPGHLHHVVEAFAYQPVIDQCEHGLAPTNRDGNAHIVEIVEKIIHIIRAGLYTGLPRNSRGLSYYNDQIMYPSKFSRVRYNAFEVT